MVRNYQRKTTGPSYVEASLKSALHAVRCGQMTVYKASKEFHVPYSTIYTHWKGVRGVVKKGKGRTTALSSEQEAKLANGIKCLEKWGFGLSRKETLELVGRFVKDNKIKTPFKNSIPGEDWFLAFKKRHKLSLKLPQCVEFARKKATDPYVINGYFDLLESTLDRLDLRDKPTNIWNLDESSLSIDPRKTKVVGERGKYASRVTSGPGRENTTILLLANAAGGKAPPLIIYKGRHMWDQWCAPNNKEYPGTVYAASSKGWMETEIFRNYFIRTLIPSIGENRPALIIYDGHSTHIDAEVIDTAIREDITILKLPPHSSHLLQPLDLSVFKSFKDKWDSKLVSWQRMNIGRKLPKATFSTFLGETWTSIDAEVIRSGFRKGGIFPFNRNVIPDDKFCPEALRRWKASSSIATNPTDEREGVYPDEANNNLPSTSRDVSVYPTNQSRRNKDICDASIADPNNYLGLSTSFESLLLQTIKQLPQPQKQSRRRVGLGCEILTSSDVVQRIKDTKKTHRTAVTQDKRTQKRKKEQSSSEEDESVHCEESDKDEDYFNEILHEVQSLESDRELIDAELSEGKWVLVKYTSKKLIKHYVGQLSHKTGDNWEIKYLKRVLTKRDTVFKFEWPCREDSDGISQDDIVKVLPDPSEDRRGLLNFNISFVGYNL